MSTAATATVGERVDAPEWPNCATNSTAPGHAITVPLLDGAECEQLSARFDGGAFVIFPTRQRPNRGKNGYHRVGMRPAVAIVTRGQRTALGVIFHDAM